MAVEAAEAGEARAVSPEETLTGLIALASSLDGVHLVLAAHEGFTYAVQSTDPKYEIMAEELAAYTITLVRESGKLAALEEAAPRILLGEYKGKALLVADVGEGFTFLALGEYPALKALTDPILRLIEGKVLRCPACGAVLDLHTYRCPSCGRNIPFTSPSCPFCGTDVSTKPCPNCGKVLRLYVSRVEAGEAAAAAPAAPTAVAAPVGEAEAVEEAAVAAGAVRVPFTRKILKTVIGLAVAAAYYAVALLLGVDPLIATLSGIVPLGTVLALLLSEQS